VTLAAHLRGRYPEAAGTIAYYHAGLPVALRRVLEDLFAAGRITTLVTAMPLVPPAAPVDVTRLVAVGLPSSRVSAAEALAAAGLGGRTGTIELCYGADTFAAARVAADLRFPDRATLVKCYRALREAAGGGPWSLPAGVDDPLPGSGLSRELVTVCLDVLTGAGAVSREDAGDVAQFAIAESSGRIDLTRSLRHLEGERERAALADLRGWALGPAGAILGDLARA
jgi:single-stranded-DNA-specific exonuclease